MDLEKRNARRRAQYQLKKQRERENRDLLWREPRGRPKRATVPEVTRIPDLPPMPLTKLLEKTKVKLSKYEGVVKESLELAEIVRELRIASTKPFMKRARHYCKQLFLYRLKVAELEEAVRDCAGIDLQEAEVFRAMHLKHGTPGEAWHVPERFANQPRGLPRGTQRKPAHHVLTGRQRQRMCQRAKKRTLQRNGWSNAVRAQMLAERSSVVAPGAAASRLAQIISGWRGEITLINDQLAVERDRAARKELLAERRGYLDLMVDVGVDHSLVFDLMR